MKKGSRRFPSDVTADRVSGKRRCPILPLPYMRSIEWRRAAFAFIRKHRTCGRCPGESVYVIGQGDGMEALCEPCRMGGTHAPEPMLFAAC